MDTNDSIEYYRKRASEYELIYQKEERQADLKKLKDLLSKDLANQRVLELACGTGYWTAVIATQAESIVGIDINESVLEIARQKDYQETPVTFQQMPYQDLRKTENSFQALFGGFIWSHVPREEITTFLSLCFNQLKKGGQMIFVDNQYIEGNSTPISRMDEFGNTYQLRQLQTGEEFEVIKNFPDREFFQEKIAGRGKSLEWLDLEYYWVVKLRKA